MKIINYITTSLGIIGAYPGYTFALTLPKDGHNNPIPGLPPDFPATPCHPEDHVFGCILPPDAKDRYCSEDSHFFDAANWDESGAGQAYMEWSKAIDLKSAAWTNRMSEPNFFAEQVLQWRDFECGVGFRGCEIKPLCDDILTKLDDKDKARKVYFILQSMQHLA